MFINDGITSCIQPITVCDASMTEGITAYTLVMALGAKYDFVCFRDRFRTTVNVMCDCIGARLVDILSVGELDKLTEMDRLNADPQELVEMSKDVHN